MSLKVVNICIVLLTRDAHTKLIIQVNHLKLQLQLVQGEE